MQDDRYDLRFVGLASLVLDSGTFTREDTHDPPGRRGTIHDCCSPKLLAAIEMAVGKLDRTTIAELAIAKTISESQREQYLKRVPPPHGVKSGYEVYRYNVILTVLVEIGCLIRIHSSTDQR